MARTRIFIVDDHELIRQALGSFIRRDGELELVGEASTARDAVKGVGRLQPDVALLDVRLPDGDGIEVCREIRSKHPETRCVIITGAEDALIDAVMAGADGYITKGLPGAQIVDAIKKVAAGGSILEGPSMEDALKALQGPDLEERKLTPRQEKLLELIGRGLTNREIASELDLAEQTVKNYVSGLLAKLGFQRRTQAAVYAAKLRSRRGGAGGGAG